MLASMIFRKEPFFHGHDNYDQVSSEWIYFRASIRNYLFSAGPYCQSLGYRGAIRVFGQVPD